MTNLLILSAAKALKGAILAGVALISWGIHAVTDHATAARAETHTVSVITCAHCQTLTRHAEVIEARAALHAARQAVRMSRHVAMLRLTQIVPPIRVEEIYSPDLLLPPSALLAAPPVPLAPATDAVPTLRDTSRTT